VVKRLTLDLHDDVHKHLKITAAELEIPMAELLRELVADALDKPTVLGDTAARIRGRATVSRT
jgi:hypothetical protein